MRYLILLFLCSCGTGCGALNENEEKITINHKLILIPEGSIAIIVPDYEAEELLRVRRQFPTYEIEGQYPNTSPK